MQRLTEEILEHSRTVPEGALLTAKGLLHLGQRAAVDQALSRLARRGKLLRAGRDRFPDDFMFQLTQEEVQTIFASRSQNVILKQGGHIKFLPFAFTEHGVLMLSSVLRSEQAVQVNIQIMRVYSKMKELLIMHKDILVKLEKLEKKSDKHDEQIQLIFSYIKKLIEQPKTKTERIGFKKEW